MALSIKISEQNYKILCELSGRLREKLHKPVSINDAISYLYSRRKVSDLAGTWKMSEKEVEEFTADLREGWGRWKIKSV